MCIFNCKECLQRLRDDMVQLLMVLFGKESRALVQVRSYTNVETAFERTVRRLSFGFAKGEILFDCRFEIRFETIYVGAFVGHHIADSQQRSMQDAVLCAVLYGAVV